MRPFPVIGHHLPPCPPKTRSATSRPSRLSAKQRIPPHSPPLATLSHTVSAAQRRPPPPWRRACTLASVRQRGSAPFTAVRWRGACCLLPATARPRRWHPPELSSGGTTRILALNRTAGSREQQTLQMNLTVLQRMDNCVVEILDMAGQVCAAARTHTPRLPLCPRISTANPRG